MCACNHAISSARTTIESLFSFKAAIGLGTAFPFNFAAREETQIIVPTPPSLCSRETFCLKSSDSLSSPSSSISSRSCRRYSKSRLYRGIGLGYPSSRAALDEAVMPVSKRCGGSDASGIDSKEYAGVGLHAPPNTGNEGQDLSASLQWSERNTTSGMSYTVPSVLPQMSSTNPESTRHLGKQPAGLGLGHPPFNSLQTVSLAPPQSSPSEPSGMGMLTSSLSISSELCRLTSQGAPKPPPRSQPHPCSQPRARTQRLFSSKLTFDTLSKFSKRSLYTIPESSIGSLDQGHGSFIRKRKGGQCSDRKTFERSVVHSYGRTLF